MSARPFVFIVASIACALAVGLVLRQQPRIAAPSEVVRDISGEADNDVFALRVSGAPSVESAERPIGLTLFPAPVESGETLRFLVGGSFFVRPDTAVHAMSSFRDGEFRVALRDSSHGDQRWIEMADGWVPAPVVDRLPEVITGVLLAGHEGLVSGRILPGDYYPEDLLEVPGDLIVPERGGGPVRLRSGALEAFREMIFSAREEGIDIRILSGYRSGSYQSLLYSRQLSEKGFFQNVSAPPGRSEHQLGTTADVTVNDAVPLRIGFGDTAAGQWVAANSEKFGLVLSFSKDRHRQRSVSYEPWHLRWVGRNVARETTW